MRRRLPPWRVGSPGVPSVGGLLSVIVWLVASFILIAELPIFSESLLPAIMTLCWHPEAGVQTSTVSGLPSSHGPCWQPSTGSQVSTVHGSPSEQSRVVPALHTPPRHVSVPLHALPSLQGEPSGATV